MYCMYAYHWRNVQLGAHGQAHTWVALARRRTPTDLLWNVVWLAICRYDIMSRDMPYPQNCSSIDSKWFPYVTYHSQKKKSSPQQLPRYNSKILVDFAVHFARASKPSSNVHPSLGKRTSGSVAPTSERIDQMAKRFHWAQLQKFMRRTKGFPFQHVLLDRRSWGDATSFTSSTFSTQRVSTKFKHRCFRTQQPQSLWAPNSSRAASCGAKLRSLAPKVRCISRRQTFILGMSPRKVGRWPSQLGLAKT